MVKKIVLFYFILFSVLSCKIQKDIECNNFSNKILVIDSMKLVEGIFDNYSFKNINLEEGLNVSLTSELISSENAINIEIIKDIKLITSFDSNEINMNWQNFQEKFLQDLKFFYIGNCSFNNVIFHFLVMRDEKKRISKLVNQSLFIIAETNSIDYIILASASIDVDTENEILCNTKYKNGEFIFTHLLDKNHGVCAKYKFFDNGKFKHLSN